MGGFTGFKHNCMVYKWFSNSLIIHKEKTVNQNRDGKVVRISDLNYDKLLRTLSLNFSKNSCSFEKLYQKLPSVFHPISRQLEVGLKKISCASFFNPLLGVWIWNETLRVVFWYITWNCWHKHFVAFVTDYRFCRLSARTMQCNDKCHTDLYSDLACISHILQYCFNIDSQCQASREA